jgi:hypothetical protein
MAHITLEEAGRHQTKSIPDVSTSHLKPTAIVVSRSSKLLKETGGFTELPQGWIDVELER